MIRDIHITNLIDTSGLNVSVETAVFGVSVTGAGWLIAGVVYKAEPWPSHSVC